MRLKTIVLVATATFVATAAQAATTSVTVTKIDEKGAGAAVGTVSFRDTKQGLLITPNLNGLPAGKHGFHIHQNASCAPGEQGGKTVAGLGAGGHFDPKKTSKHLGPEGNGHLGDLPVLVVDAGGTAILPSLALRLKVRDIRKHALIIHSGGDNYSDEPAPLGGGGARIACGMIK